MAIQYQENGRIFTLHTDHSTYQMKADSYGNLLHLYYGDRTEGSMEYMLTFEDRGFSPNPYEAGDDRTYSLDALPQEYPHQGSGDFRSPAFAVEQAGRSYGLNLRYAGYEICKGKYSLPGLPAMYGEGREDAESLKIRLTDQVSGLAVTLLYGVFPGYDIITRAVCVENGGDGPAALKRVYSACLDFLHGEYDLIQFYGRHAMERNFQRTALCHGAQVIGSRRGTSSHQYNPFLILAGRETTEASGPCYSMSFVYSGPFKAEAETDQYGQTRMAMGLQDEMEGLQQFLDDVMGQQDGEMKGLSFWGLMKELMKGNLKGILGQTGMGLKNALFSQVDRGGQMLFQVAAIGLIGAVFTNVSSVFKAGQISDTGFFVTYLLLFTCLAASFSASLQVAAQVMEQILEFMKLLMPAYYMAVAFSGGSMSALALYECMMGAVTGVQWLCSTVLLSMVRIYVLMVLGSHVAKEALLSRLTELLEQAVVWSLRTLTGLVVGFHLIQAMILPHADAAGQAGMKRLMEMIPGLGQGAGAMAQMVLGSGVLIKNTMGAAAVVVLAVISAVPVMKLTVLMVMYQCVAAVMQPVCDKRVVSCVAGVSKGHKLLLQIVLYSMFLFMIAIAVTCASTNVNYFAS